LPTEEIETAEVSEAVPANEESFAEERSAPVVEETPVEDRAAFASKIGEKLRALKLDSDSDDEISGTDESADPAETPVAGADAVKPEENVESQDAAVKAPAKSGVETPTLPDSYRRSLKAYGWEDADIDHNLQVMGRDFIDTAAKIHSNRNSEVGQWAEAGRQAREQQQHAVDTTVSPARQGASPTGGLQPLDVAELTKEYGEDALITKVVLPMNAMIEQMNRMLPAVQETQRRANQAEQDMLLQQIDGFFGGKGMDTYKDVYGSGDKLKEEHFAARNKVLEMADALVVGASLQHRKLSFGDAMQMAHDSVSSGFKKQEARAEIKGQLTKRARGTTLRPSSRQSAKKSGEGMTHEELVKVVGQKLAAMRGD